ncbi:Bax inhibitor-1/YccA family protein [Frankia sp. AgB1.9]|uniref:Bax inhibitor-1/YccA family protein n=1 Tax=unclassified Frankia TaxID=2632575 RepID=UPI001933F717|nr:MULTISPECIES: Bax inhibitor-1/YccA family protein [unclassified Frankia]MBL7487839.1 Bax inhibitor-1/YccA family protein [Frankia sp. AgW1.1]MBL7547181.1 Bax inhibitor-1/YccA family protein [Frankia sp. AgB1.9]MBL7620119.1 Bax inhibitor-1/YccA family protein [Frankia sp. AgB1.8]
MARTRSSNPVFTHLRSGTPASDQLTWPPSAQGTPPGTPTPEELARVYRQPSSLTIDDVVMHTLGLFAIAGVGGAVGWYLVDRAPGLVFGAGIAAFVLSLVIRFTGRINPALVVVFGVLSGLMAGGVSRLYANDYAGIIPQAILGTAVIFVTMLLAYRSRRLRATPRMARIVGNVLLAVVIISIIDVVLRLTTGSHLPVINDATPLGILFSVVVLVIASLQFILDFDAIERMIAARAPRSDAWVCAYGLLIGFIWVYLEMLRLLSKLRR